MPFTTESVLCAFDPLAVNGQAYRSGRSAHWLNVKNPKAPAVNREAEEDWR